MNVAQTLTSAALQAMAWPPLAAERTAFLRARRDALGEHHDELHQKLLADGGTFVVPQPEPDASRIVALGRSFTGVSVRVLRGEPSQCHGNAAARWLTARNRLRIVAGYGLSDDGGWRQHTWLWDGVQIHETTLLRLAYFGVVLAPVEALMFAAIELLAPPASDPSLARAWA